MYLTSHILVPAPAFRTHASSIAAFDLIFLPALPRSFFAPRVFFYFFFVVFVFRLSSFCLCVAVPDELALPAREDEPAEDRPRHRAHVLPLERLLPEPLLLRGAVRGFFHSTPPSPSPPPQ